MREQAPACAPMDKKGGVSEGGGERVCKREKAPGDKREGEWEKKEFANKRKVEGCVIV